MKTDSVPAYSSRHAYLITAYDNFDVVDVLLQMLDDPRNDIYIHVDKSVKDCDTKRFQSLCRYSPVTVVPRIRVHWGHYSQIRSVFTLLTEATRTHHSYYHLLSGSDLPIKSQDYIHDFCERNAGKEFVGFSDVDFLERVRLFYLFNTYRRPANRRQALARYFLQLASSASLSLQHALGVDRLRNVQVEIKKGSDWFSISHELATYVLSKKAQIRQLFRFAEIPTEFYVQTMIWNSSFKEHIFDPDDEFASSMRFFDWSRGDPYVFRRSDRDDLIRSDRLFARKFLAGTDMEIVNSVRLQFSRNFG